MNKKLCLVIYFLFSIALVSNASENIIWVSDFGKLNELKNLLSQKNKEAMAKLNSITKKADKELHKGNYSVMHKKMTPPSGNKHDYMTIAPYSWPNPDSNTGLPYINKDGQINPETRNNNTDFVEADRFFEAINNLKLAYFYTEDQKYANKAIELLKIWFLNEDTKMNPHLNYAQSVPGLNDGRCFGIIEFSGIRGVIECLETLEYFNQLDAQTKQGMITWLEEYANWLQISELGIMEGTRSNNHATWYDVQLCSIHLYLGNTKEVKTILENAKNRIASQIEPDGSQPHELKRTKAFSYSTMNLEAFTRLAMFGQKTNIDLWNFQTPDGRSIKQAYYFLMPYINGDKEWDYKQLKNTGDYKDRLRKLFQLAGETFNEPEFIKIGMK